MSLYLLTVTLAALLGGRAFHRLQGSYTGPVVDRLVGDDSPAGVAGTYNRKGVVR